MNLQTLLRCLALLAFAIAAYICLRSDAPDVFDVFAAVSLGLFAWVLSTLVPAQLRFRYHRST